MNSIPRKSVDEETNIYIRQGYENRSVYPEEEKSELRGNLKPEKITIELNGEIRYFEYNNIFIYNDLESMFDIRGNIIERDDEFKIYNILPYDYSFLPIIYFEFASDSEGNGDRGYVKKNKYDLMKLTSKKKGDYLSPSIKINIYIISILKCL